MKLDPEKIAVHYYFGDLSYWKLPHIAADALEMGYDGIGLRWLAGLTDPVWSDMRTGRIDSAFMEMGVSAPIPRDRARLILAAESANEVIHGDFNVFDAATYIRIRLCELRDPPEELRRIVELSRAAKCAPREEWDRLERELKDALSEFLISFA